MATTDRIQSTGEYFRLIMEESPESFVSRTKITSEIRGVIEEEAAEIKAFVIESGDTWKEIVLKLGDDECEE